ncbi:MAG: hemerythrin domain-containing protein [Caldimonas sp.]
MSTPKTRTERPRRTPAPPLPPFEALDRTHHEVLQMLAQMHMLAEKVEVRGTDEGMRKLAREICRFFDDTARPHHEAEEQLVFPALLASGDAELVQHVERLQQDHGWLEEDWLELSPHLQAIAGGQNWYDLDVLRTAIPVFSDLYHEHIALEETVVYPASRRQHAAPAAKNAP